MQKKKHSVPVRRLGAGLLTALFVALPGLEALAAEVNIYSYRKEHLIRPLLDAFTKSTGTKVNLVTGKADALLERLKAEGRNSPADVLLTVDAGRLIRAKQAGVLQPVKSAALDAAVPAQYRDPDGEWFGLSVRARVIFRSVDRVPASAIKTYADLADPKWKQKICIRSSKNVYNQSLLASRMAHDGAAAAADWAKGVVANMARKPQGGDRDQIRAVAAGECDIAVSNHYYYARLVTSKKAKDRAVAAKVVLVWPDQDGRGSHVNVSGAGVTKSAKNRAQAISLIEFLAGDAAQKIYADVVNEYPVRPGIDLSKTVSAFGPFKADALPLSRLATGQVEAVRIFDRAGWR